MTHLNKNAHTAWVAAKHAAGFGLGISLMVLGSTVAKNAHDLEPWLHVPATLLDTAAYFIHGFGAIPIYEHIASAWQLIGVAATEGGE